MITTTAVEYGKTIGMTKRESHCFFNYLHRQGIVQRISFGESKKRGKKPMLWQVPETLVIKYDKPSVN